MAIHWPSQTCLLTGASGGIGQQIATLLDKKGVQLWLQGRNEEKLKALQAQLLNGHRHKVICGDLNHPTCREHILDQAIQSDDLSMLINNAGISGSGCVSDLTEDKITQVLQTNLTTTVLLCHTLLPMLLKHSNPTLINVGSIFGSIGHPGYALYSASKFGLRGFTEALQREYSDTNIQIQYFAPRATKTSINGNNESLLNNALGNHVDEPHWVAQQLISSIEKQSARTFLGFPESLFVKINGVFPTLVDSALQKKLPLIKQYLSNREN